MLNGEVDFRIGDGGEQGAERQSGGGRLVSRAKGFFRKDTEVVDMFAPARGWGSQLSSGGASST